MAVDGNPTKIAMILSLMIVSTLSALSGVGKGIKWLSNINMGLSFFILAYFLVLAQLFLRSARCLSPCGFFGELADDDSDRLVRRWHWRRN